jgi:hypothetical protein
MFKPYHECPSFNSCSSPLCPLDPNVALRVRYSDEAKCKAEKPTRFKIGSKYPNLLPYQGLTKQEWLGKKMSEAYRVNQGQLLPQQGEKGQNFRQKAIVAAIAILFSFLIFSSTCFASPLSTHFDSKELSCHHCHQVIINKELLNKLELLRAKLGKPIIINSAYRCPIHNKQVGGVKNSQHLQGKAADIQVKGLTPVYVAKIAKQVGFTFVKVYPNFVHVDVR